MKKGRQSAAGKKVAARNRAQFVGPPKPFHVVVGQELQRNRVNVAFKALSLYSVSGCDIEARDHFEAIRRAAEHNKRDDEHHHVQPGQIFRERSHLNEVLRGPATVDAVVDLARNILAEFDIVPPRVDSIVGIEWVMFPGPLPDPRQFYEWANGWVERRLNIPTCASDRHADQRADHAHTLALPIKDGKLAGNELSSGGNKFEILQRQFLEAAEVEFGHIVRAGHDRKGATGGSTKGGLSTSTTGGQGEPRRLPRATGGSSIGGQAPHQPPYLRGLLQPPSPVSFTSLGFELCGDHLEGSHCVPGRTAQPAFDVAALLCASAAEANTAIVAAMVTPSAGLLALRAARMEAEPPKASASKASDTTAAPTPAAELAVAVVSRLEAGEHDGVVGAALRLLSEMQGRGWVSVVDISLWAPKGMRGLNNKLAYQALGVLKATGRVEEGHFQPRNGKTARGFRAIGPEVEAADRARDAERDSANDAAVLALLTGEWTNSTAMALLKVPGLIRTQVIRDALDRLTERGLVVRRAGRQRNAWEYRKAPTESNPPDPAASEDAAPGQNRPAKARTLARPGVGGHPMAPTPSWALSTNSTGEHP